MCILYRPTARTKRIVMLSLLALVVVWTALCVVMVYAWSRLRAGAWWAVGVCVVGGVGVAALALLLWRQPRNDARLHFRTPLVPWTPLASVLVNIFLMVTLSPATWIRFAVWMTIGSYYYYNHLTASFPGQPG